MRIVLAESDSIIIAYRNMCFFTFERFSNFECANYGTIDGKLSVKTELKNYQLKTIKFWIMLHTSHYLYLGYSWIKDFFSLIIVMHCVTNT